MRYAYPPPWLEVLHHLVTPRLDDFLADRQASIAAKTALRWRYDLFISYRFTEAEPYVKTLTARLQGFGFRVFYASQHDFANLDDDALQDRLRDALQSSAALLHVGSRDPFGGDWVRLENEIFTEGRFGLLIGLITDATPAYEATVLRMRSEIDSIIIYEETENAWQSAVASETTILSIAVAVSLYKVALRTKIWAWMLPSRRLRSKLYFTFANHNRACRKWIVSFLLYHGFLWMPPDLMDVE